MVELEAGKGVVEASVAVECLGVHFLVSRLHFVFLVPVPRGECLHHCLAISIGLCLLALLPLEAQCLSDLLEVL